LAAETRRLGYLASRSPRSRRTSGSALRGLFLPALASAALAPVMGQSVIGSMSSSFFGSSVCPVGT
jgi:hypothetical protein